MHLPATTASVLPPTMRTVRSVVNSRKGDAPRRLKPHRESWSNAQSTIVIITAGYCDQHLRARQSHVHGQFTNEKEV